MINNQTISKRGGKREGAGRKAGVPNKVGADLRELAQEYTSEALAALVEMVRGDNGPSKVAAAREILDRGHGKASLTLDGKLGVELALVAHKIIE
jgi:hypothetical protein